MRTTSRYNLSLLVLSSAVIACGAEDASPRHSQAASRALLVAGDSDAGSDLDGGAGSDDGDLTTGIGAPERISADFSLAEGPVWDHCGKRLLFTDVNASAILQLSAAGEISTYRAQSNYANALVFDAEGALLAAEMGGGAGGRITRTDRAGQLSVLVDRTATGGKLNTSDDLALRSDGTIYFSDPTIPHADYFGFSLSAQPVYRLTAGEPRLLVKESQTLLPNGVDLSPDERVLYVAGYLLGQILRFDVAEDGSLSNQRTLLRGLSSPDSMCLDAAGNLYIGTRNGIEVARPDGTRAGTIAIRTTQGVTNCAFGGDDGKTLYVTAWNSLWRVPNMPHEGLDWTLNQRIACD